MMSCTVHSPADSLAQPTFYIFLISRLGLDRVILVFDTVIHTNKGVFDLY